VLLSNKDWSSGDNAGWAVIARQDAKDAIGSNYGTGTDRMDLRTIDSTPDTWRFVVATFDPRGTSMLYVGHDDRRIRWIAQATSVSALGSGLALHLGQDGTSNYPSPFRGYIDELTIWRRALTHDEVMTLHRKGAGTAISLSP
jgi:hypothetical protein